MSAVKKLYEVSAYADAVATVQVDLSDDELAAVVKVITKLEAEKEPYAPSFSVQEINGRGGVVRTVIAL